MAACSPPSARAKRAPRISATQVWFYKASVFTISAGLSGLAGGLFAMAQLAAFPDVMSLHQSGYIVMMTLVGGGLVSFWGPVVGVFTFLIARDVIGAHDQRLDALVRPAVHRRSCCSSRKALPARSAPSSMAPKRKRAACARRVGLAPAVPELSMALIEAKGVHVRFGDRVVLEEVDMSVLEKRMPRHHGTERRRQDHLLQCADRPRQADARRALPRRRECRRPPAASHRAQRRGALVPDHDVVRRISPRATM